MATKKKTVEQKPAEQQIEEKPVEQILPPGAPAPVIPPVQQYVGIYSAGNRFYRNPDEAIQASRENAARMWYDLSIHEPLQSRILSVAQLPFHIEAEDKKDKKQRERATQVQQIIENIPGFLKLKVALLYAIWFGKAGVQLDYQWAFDKLGRKYLSVKNWSPVHGDSIYFKWDKPREVGILVTSPQGEGTKSLSTEPTDVGMAHVLTPWEREAFLVHTHLHLGSDYYKLLKAGTSVGIGLRDVVYWTWYLKQETMSLLQEFIERVGTGITIYRYESGNNQSETAVRQIAESQTSNCQILWPYMPGETKSAAGVERIEPSSVGVDNLKKIVDYFDDQLKRYIVGQNLTSESVSTGLGSRLADVHENTFFRLIKLDAVNLAETLSKQLVHIIHKYSFPEDDFRLKYVINCERPDPEKFLVAAERFWDMGGAIDADELRSVIGLTQPEGDAIILKKTDTDQKTLPMQNAFAGGSNTFAPSLGLKRRAKVRMKAGEDFDLSEAKVIESREDQGDRLVVIEHNRLPLVEEGGEFELSADMLPFFLSP